MMSFGGDRSIHPIHPSNHPEGSIDRSIDRSIATIHHPSAPSSDDGRRCVSRAKSSSVARSNTTHRLASPRSSLVAPRPDPSIHPSALHREDTPRDTIDRDRDRGDDARASTRARRSMTDDETRASRITRAHRIAHRAHAPSRGRDDTHRGERRHRPRRSSASICRDGRSDGRTIGRPDGRTDGRALPVRRRWMACDSSYMEYVYIVYQYSFIQRNTTSG